MEKEGNEVSASGLTRVPPHPWPRTSETHSHPFTFLPCVLLTTSFPAAPLLPSLLSSFLTAQPGPRLALPWVSVAPLPSPTNLLAVRRHEVEAAGGDGESDWHSSKFQVAPPQDGTERAATGLRKDPRVSEERGSQFPRNPHTPAFGLPPHRSPTCPCPAPPSSQGIPNPSHPGYLSPS